MADWQQWLSTCFITVVFAYMVSKLFQMVKSVRQENLRVELRRISPLQLPEEINPAQYVVFDNAVVEREVKRDVHIPSSVSDGIPIITDTAVIPESATDIDLQESSTTIEPVIKDDDDPILISDSEWESIAGIDLIDFRREFCKATSFFEQLVTNPSFNISNEMKLQFYGFYKQATEGPCLTSQPSVYRPRKRAKWQAWKRLGDISPEDGMKQYIALLSEICPDWNTSSKNNETSSDQAAGHNEKTVGVVSILSMPVEQSSGHEGLEDIHMCAKKGDIKGLEKLLDHTQIDQLDCEGRTALHWSADQGHLDIVKLLVFRGARINAKDSDGLTALHYAATSQCEEIIKFLLENGAVPGQSNQVVDIQRLSETARSCSVCSFVIRHLN